MTATRLSRSRISATCTRKGCSAFACRSSMADRARRFAPTASPPPSLAAIAPRQRCRRLGPARDARHGLAHAAAEGRVGAGKRAADAARRLFPRRDLVAAHVPDALADLYGAGAGGL